MANQPQIYIMLNENGQRNRYAQIAKFKTDKLEFYDIWPLNADPENIDFAAANHAIGTIYSARITQIDDKTQLAFLDLGKINAVMRLNPKQKFNEGQYILAEIISEAYDDKNLRTRYAGDAKADGKNKTGLYRQAESLAQYCLGLMIKDNARIICDDFAFYAALKKQADNDAIKVGLADVEMGKKHSQSLLEKHGLLGQIEELQQSQIGLENGGNIIIEHTIAMTVVDVNSGAYTGNDMVNAVNRQAAQKLFAQLSLRHIGGLIVVDFLKYKKKDERQNFAAYLRQLSGECQIEMGSYTALGLAEFKIKRMGKRLSDKLLDFKHD